ncbi:MAG TPA: DUF2934 domain-containing protein [Acidobacteriaceae bacterium]|jgi:hypothetical protein|nr:DUF2934 domain-containing protein [Acidobacteriaceae bacterium]
MTDTTKKTKAPAKPRKIAAKKSEVTAIDQPKGVSHEEVATLAHRFWAERGHRHGNHVDDWFRAEQELRGKAS